MQAHDAGTRRGEHRAWAVQTHSAGARRSDRGQGMILWYNQGVGSVVQARGAANAVMAWAHGARGPANTA